MKSLKLAVLLLSASAIAFDDTYCLDDAHPDAMTIDLSTDREKTSDGCSLNSDLTVDASAAITTGASPVFQFLRGTVQQSRGIIIRPFLSADPTGSLPFTIDIKDNTFELNSYLSFDGNFPPNSAITISGNLHSNSLPSGVDVEGTRSNQVPFHFSSTVGAGSTVTLAENKLELFTANGYSAYVFDPSAVLLSNSVLLIDNNTFAEYSPDLNPTQVVTIQAALTEATVTISNNIFSGKSTSGDRILKYVVIDDPICQSCSVNFLANQVYDNPDISSGTNIYSSAFSFVSGVNALDGITLTVKDNVFVGAINDPYTAPIDLSLLRGEQIVVVTNNTITTTSDAAVTEACTGPVVKFSEPSKITATISRNEITSAGLEAGILISAPDGIPAASTIYAESNTLTAGAQYFGIDFAEPINAADSSVVISVSQNSFTGDGSSSLITYIAGATTASISGTFYFCGNILEGTEITTLPNGALLNDNGGILTGYEELDQCGSMPTQPVTASETTTSDVTTASETTTSETTTSTTTPTSSTTPTSTTTPTSSTTPTSTTQYGSLKIATQAITRIPSKNVSVTRSVSGTVNECLGTLAVCKKVYLYEATAAAMARATCDDSRNQSNASLSANFAYNELALDHTNSFYYVVSSASPTATFSMYNLTGMADYRLLSFVVNYQQSRNEVSVAAKDLSNETKVMGVRAFRNFTTIVDVAIKVLSLQWDEVIAKDTVMASGINVTFAESCEWPFKGWSYSRIVAIERSVVYMPRKVFEKSITNLNLASANAALTLSVGAVAMPIAAIQQGVALSLVRMAQCDGDSLDGSQLDPSVHPLRFGLGDGIMKYARGAVLGNLFIIPGVWAVLWYLVVSHAVSAWRRQSLPTSREFVGWPGFAITPFSILSEGSAMACVALLFTASDSAVDAVIGGVGLALLLASMVAWVRSLWLLSKLKSRSLECRLAPSTGILRLLKPRYEWLLVSRSKVQVNVDILLPSQVAKQETNESDAIAASYLEGRLAFVGDSWWMWSHVAASALSVVVGVAEGLSLSDTSQCKTRWVFASVAAILQGFVVLTNTVLAEVALLGIICIITFGLIIAISLSTFGVTEFSDGTFDALNALGIANSVVGVILMVLGVGVSVLEANTKASKKAVASSLQSTTVASFWGLTDAFDQELTQMPTLLIESDTEEVRREESRTLPPTAEHESSSNNYSGSLKLEKSL